MVGGDRDCGESMGCRHGQGGSEAESHRTRSKWGRMWETQAGWGGQRPLPSPVVLAGGPASRVRMGLRGEIELGCCQPLS